jgi:hypothetical protein
VVQDVINKDDDRTEGDDEDEEEDDDDLGMLLINCNYSKDWNTIDCLIEPSLTCHELS